MVEDVFMRAATRADLAAIVRLLADDELGSQREQDEEPLPAGYEQALAAIEQDVNNELIVAELGGEVVGTMQLTVIPRLATSCASAFDIPTRPALDAA